MTAQLDKATRIQRRILEDGSVIVPPRIADWLERHAGVTADRRVRLRGVDPEAYEVLAALHLDALHHSSSVRGTKVVNSETFTTRSDLWLTTEEAAKQADVTDRCIRKWIAEGRLPATRHGGHWLINRQALNANRAAQYRRRTKNDNEPVTAAVESGIDP